MYKALKQQILAILWTVFVLVLCFMKMPQSNDGPSFFFEGFDKMTHLGFFFVLSILIFHGKIKFQHNFSVSISTIFKILLINAIIGGGIELLQWKVFTYRSAEWWDFACDMIGACMAIFSYLLLHKSNLNEKSN
ncbi:glycine cleavage system protein H [Pedobacter changchengzhani]|uniref:Glycine cleavage system protein H n=1 Tax=Pedobacter changchengzhani TaxID=2529274 RepID=A0A4R5MQZ0_9SPHI|nr:VanZ family protein [Pedobacter changchengzhani]TDG37759.1 glycine cleavage system protein H [Pedobacter changchengzhani]